MSSYAQRWCDQANAQKSRDDAVWIVGQNGIPMLVDDEAVMEARRMALAREQEEERRRFNWRLMHPVTETPSTPGTDWADSDAA